MTPPATSAAVVEALRAGPFPERAYAWLFEVRNRTGYGGAERYADALVVSCWPSRGIWIAGIEIKVTRGDWKREIENPAKSEPIQKFCDYWWVAAPAGIVELSELPETWGLLIVEGKRVLRAKEAPKLAPEPLSRAFVASCLRNQSQALERVRNLARDDGYRLAMKRVGDARVATIERELAEARREAERLRAQLGYKEREVAALGDAARQFEQGAGLPAGAVGGSGGWGARRVGEAYRAASLLAELPPEKLAERFHAVAEALRGLGAEKRTDAEKC